MENSLLNLSHKLRKIKAIGAEIKLFVVIRCHVRVSVWRFSLVRATITASMPLFLFIWHDKVRTERQFIT